MRGLMAKVDACICYIDKISNIFLIADQYFEMTLENTFWFQDRQTAIFVNCFNKL